MSSKFYFVVHGRDRFHLFPVHMVLVLDVYSIGLGVYVNKDGAFHASPTRLLPLAPFEAEAIL